MKLILEDGQEIELVPFCKKAKGESGTWLEVVDGQFAIPGRKVATAEQIQSWASENSARIVY